MAYNIPLGGGSPPRIGMPQPGGLMPGPGGRGIPGGPTQLGGGQPPVMHSPLMNAFSALGAGLNQGQLQHLLAGHLPGEEHGYFANAQLGGQGLSPQQLQLIGQMARNGRFAGPNAMGFQQFENRLQNVPHIPVDVPPPHLGGGQPPVMHPGPIPVDQPPPHPGQQQLGNLPTFMKAHPWFQRMVQQFGLQGH